MCSIDNDKYYMKSNYMEVILFNTLNIFKLIQYNYHYNTISQLKKNPFHNSPAKDQGSWFYLSWVIVWLVQYIPSPLFASYPGSATVISVANQFFIMMLSECWLMEPLVVIEPETTCT